MSVYCDLLDECAGGVECSREQSSCGCVWDRNGSIAYNIIDGVDGVT